MGNDMLYMAANALKGYYNEADDIVKSVINHAVAAAGAAALSGCVPGAGSTIAASVSIGIIVKMYVSLGNMLGIHLGNGMLKALASAIVADLAGSVVAMLAVSTVLSFIPGLGTLGAAGITGLTSFCYVYLAGVIYITIVGKIVGSGKSVNSMTEEELKEAARQAAGSMDMKKAVKEATSAYKNNK